MNKDNLLPDGHHPFDQAIQLKSTAPDLYSGHFGKTYANMVGPFGGVIAAVMLKGVLLHPSHQGDPVSVTINFAGPISDAPFELTAQPLRTNRSNQHWFVKLSQDNQIAVTATMVLATRKETWQDTEVVAPMAPMPETIEPWVPPDFPAFLRCYEFRFAKGSLTLSAKPIPSSESILWVRDQPKRPLDFLSLLSLSDIFIPRIFVRKQQPGVASSVSMTTYFHVDSETLARQEARPILAIAQGQRFYKGYFDQAAQLWSDAGQLLATSSQMVYFRD